MTPTQTMDRVEFPVPAGTTMDEARPAYNGIAPAQSTPDEIVENVGHREAYVPAGRYLVHCTVEPAEGEYLPGYSGLEWREPEPNENTRIEIRVRDAHNVRFLRQLAVEVTLLDDTERVVATHEHPFSWPPWLFQYARNWSVPEDATYTILVRISAPVLHLAEQNNRLGYFEPQEVEFRDLKIRTSGEPSVPMV